MSSFKRDQIIYIRLYLQELGRTEQPGLARFSTDKLVQYRKGLADEVAVHRANKAQAEQNARDIQPDIGATLVKLSADAKPGHYQVEAGEAKRVSYRVTYGESAPVWNKEFTGWDATAAYIKRCLDRGDLVFNVEVL